MLPLNRNLKMVMRSVFFSDVSVNQRTIGPFCTEHFVHGMEEIPNSAQNELEK